MKVNFLGAAQTVTGSCYIIETGGVRFGIDCGMHQGNKEIEKRNYETELYDPAHIDFFLLTHAHIDHSGLLPRVVAGGFKGPIYCTEPTARLLDIMLQDSAHIQEMEAEWENLKLKRKGQNNGKVAPLYTQEDAIETSKHLKPVQYNESFSPAPGVKVTYRDAGHILGSAFLELEITENDNEVTRFVFSGDLGRSKQLLLSDPDVPKLRPDYLFVESTYGDRNHKDLGPSRDEFLEAINYCHNSGGKVVIPAFAVERTQEVLYILSVLHKEGKLPRNMPIFVDSPLAIRATRIFREFPSYFQDHIAGMFTGDGELDLPDVRFTLTTEESQQINAYEGPCIIISASGMCNAGRVKHHLRHNIWNKKCAVVFVGYQGVGTPGRKIVDGAKTIRMLGEDLGINAKIYTIGGFSAHAGQSQILDWIGNFAHPDLHVMLVHGEEKAQKTLSGLIKERFGLESSLPVYLEEMTLAPGLTPMVQLDPARSRPRVNWDFLLAESDAKISGLKSLLDQIKQLSWEEQTELRDIVLEINNLLSKVLART